MTMVSPAGFFILQHIRGGLYFSIVLQDKLNTYLEFVESGQLYAKYPRAVGRKIVFEVMGKFALSKEASKFYQIVGNAVQKYGCTLQFVHYIPDGESKPTCETGS